MMGIIVYHRSVLGFIEYVIQKQNFVLGGVETEFCFEWTGNGIPFWRLGNETPFPCD